MKPHVLLMPTWSYGIRITDGIEEVDNEEIYGNFGILAISVLAVYPTLEHYPSHLICYGDNENLCRELNEYSEESVTAAISRDTTAVARLHV